MEEGRAHEEVALAPAHRGRRLARPVFLAAVALALFSFVAIVSGGEISSGLQQMRDVIGAKERVPIARRRLRDAAAPVWFASLRAASRSERRAREDAQSPLYVLSATWRTTLRAPARNQSRTTTAAP